MQSTNFMSTEKGVCNSCNYSNSTKEFEKNTNDGPQPKMGITPQDMHHTSNSLLSPNKLMVAKGNWWYAKVILFATLHANLYTTLHATLLTTLCAPSSISIGWWSPPQSISLICIKSWFFPPPHQKSFYAPEINELAHSKQASKTLSNNIQNVFPLPRYVGPEPGLSGGGSVLITFEG